MPGACIAAAICLSASACGICASPRREAPMGWRVGSGVGPVGPGIGGPGVGVGNGPVGPGIGGIVGAGVGPGIGGPGVGVGNGPVGSGGPYSPVRQANRSFLYFSQTSSPASYSGCAGCGPCMGA